MNFEEIYNLLGKISKDSQSHLNLKPDENTELRLHKISKDLGHLSTMITYLKEGEEGLNMMFKSIKQDYSD